MSMRTDGLSNAATHSPDFGGALKEMREACRISQSKLAERADFDHSYVSRLESGGRMPTRDAVERLSEAMALAQHDEDELLARAGFLPRDVSSLLTDEPVVGRLLGILQNENVSSQVKSTIRGVVTGLVELASAHVQAVERPPTLAAAD